MAKCALGMVTSETILSRWMVLKALGRMRASIVVSELILIMTMKKDHIVRKVSSLYCPPFRSYRVLFRSRRR